MFLLFFFRGEKLFFDRFGILLLLLLLFIFDGNEKWRNGEKKKKKNQKDGKERKRQTGTEENNHFLAGPFFFFKKRKIKPTDPCPKERENKYKKCPFFFERELRWIDGGKKRQTNHEKEMPRWPRREKREKEREKQKERESLLRFYVLFLKEKAHIFFFRDGYFFFILRDFCFREVFKKIVPRRKRDGFSISFH